MKKKTLRKIYRTIRSVILDTIAVASFLVVLLGVLVWDCGLTKLSLAVWGVAIAYLVLYGFANIDAGNVLREEDYVEEEW